MSRRPVVARRGFTLVELMVAVSTGLTVGLAAFLLAKVSLGSFQQDARINNAQHAVLMAMNRVTADVKRAGFMTTPHAADDADICQRVVIPGAQQDLLIAANVFEGKPGGGNFYNVAAYGLGVPNDALPSVATGVQNNRFPDRLRFSGNYMTTERIMYRSVNGGDNTVNLAIETNAVQRIYRDSPPGPGQTVCRMFPNDRILRLVDEKQKDTYVRITSCVEAEAGGYLTSASIQFAPLGGSTPNVPGVCSVRSGKEGTVNTVNVFEYSVQQIAQPFGATELNPHGLPANMAPMVRWDNGALGQTIGEDTRMDLLRRELDWTGAVIPDSGEVVAEWVVDFRLRMRFTNAAGGPNPTLLDTGFDKDDGAPAGEPPRPQRIRTIGVRLSTRSREPDRESRIGVAPAFTTPIDRFEVFPTATVRKNRMARVRTMYTEVSLPNLATVTW